MMLLTEGMQPEGFIRGKIMNKGNRKEGSV
jgi:hypothetical protein